MTDSPKWHLGPSKPGERGRLTDAEAKELDAMERLCKLGELDGNERELNRLYWLRLRAAGCWTWQEVLDAINESIEDGGLEKAAPGELLSLDVPTWLARARLENLEPSGQFVTVQLADDSPWSEPTRRKEEELGSEIQPPLPSVGQAGLPSPRDEPPKGPSPSGSDEPTTSWGTVTVGTCERTGDT